jgi:Flp pilus assembly pilin Flp
MARIPLEEQMNKLARLGKDTRGIELIEVVILIALVVLVAFGAWQTLGHKINQKVQQVNNDLN